MTTTTLSFDNKVLEPIFRELYSQATKNMPDYVPAMYDVSKTTKETESIEMIGGGGLMEEWSHSNKQVYYGEKRELWQKYIKQEKFSAGRQIDRDFMRFLKLDKMKDEITSLADEVYQTRQKQGAEWFVNGNQAQGPDFRGRIYNSLLPDGKPLFATDHPFYPGYVGEGQSNLGTQELTIDAVDDAIVAMQAWRNDQGNIMPVMPDTLFVSPYNMRAAKQIVGINGKGEGYEPGNNLHNINVFEGTLKVVVNPFFNFGNRKAWVLADSNRMKKAMKWYESQSPENGNMEDFDTEIKKFKVVGLWGKGCVDWTWGYGNYPTA